MKAHTAIVAMVLGSLSMGAFALNPTSPRDVSINVNDESFLQPKSFGKFSFHGCVVQVDATSGDNYFHIGGTKLFTSGKQVTIEFNGGRNDTKYENKELFVAEYIYRQNYCSFVRK